MWFNNGSPCRSLPLTIAAMDPICHHPEGGVRIGNHVVDGQDRPWLFGSMPGRPGGVLWHRTQAGWDELDMASATSTLNVKGGRATALSQDASGRLYLAVAANPHGQETRWFDPSLELFHLMLDAGGKVASLAQLTETDPSVANWLPALEQWDWSRSGTCCVGGPWLAYTRGLNAGGIGGDNRDALATHVYLAKV